MARLAAGDEAALSAAYDEYSARVFGLALRVVRDPLQAEEVTQDVFAAAWRHRAEFNASRGSLCAWLLAAARNRAIDVTRRRRARQHLEGGMPAEPRSPLNVEDAVLVKLDRQAIAAVVAGLPPEQGHAIRQAYFGGWSAREIAVRAGVPLSTVKGRMRLGLELLARDIELRSATRLA